MMSTIIGGAMLPHAPQFFTLPETEDKATVEKVRAVAAEIGSKLKALKPDLWIIFSNDHAEQFFHHTAPPFTIHVGGEASGEFAGRKFHWKIPSEISFELVRQLYRQNFDPAFTSTATTRSPSPWRCGWGRGRAARCRSGRAASASRCSAARARS